MQTTFTTAEIAGLSGLDEKQVRKDQELEVVLTLSPPRFDEAQALYFMARANLGWDLPPSARQHLARRIAEAFASGDLTIRWGLGWTLDLTLLHEELHRRWAAFQTWVEDRTSTDPDILGGDPTFRDTRLSVRRVGGLRLRGEPTREILEDYPYLSEDDVEMATLFTQVRPRRGRPVDG